MRDDQARTCREISAALRKSVHTIRTSVVLLNEQGLLLPGTEEQPGTRARLWAITAEGHDAAAQSEPQRSPAVEQLLADAEEIARDNGDTWVDIDHIRAALDQPRS